MLSKNDLRLMKFERKRVINIHNQDESPISSPTDTDSMSDFES